MRLKTFQFAKRSRSGNRLWKDEFPEERVYRALWQEERGDEPVDAGAPLGPGEVLRIVQTLAGNEGRNASNGARVES